MTLSHTSLALLYLFTALQYFVPQQKDQNLLFDQDLQVNPSDPFSFCILSSNSLFSLTIALLSCISATRGKSSESLSLFMYFRDEEQRFLACFDIKFFCNKSL